jgi:hypothetical protein
MKTKMAGKILAIQGTLGIENFLKLKIRQAKPAVALAVSSSGR